MVEWISVDEKLPEQMQTVVAAKFYAYDCEPDAAVCYFLNGEFCASSDALSACNYDGGCHISLDIDVTHWFPLEVLKNDKA